MRINVTQEHIDNGSVQNTESCPVALAVVSQTGRMTRVFPDYIFIEGETRIDLPSKAKQFVDDFDELKFVEPFSFNLPIKEKGQINDDAK